MHRQGGLHNPGVPVCWFEDTVDSRLYCFSKQACGEKGTVLVSTAYGNVSDSGKALGKPVGISTWAVDPDLGTSRSTPV